MIRPGNSNRSGSIARLFHHRLVLTVILSAYGKMTKRNAVMKQHCSRIALISLHQRGIYRLRAVEAQNRDKGCAMTPNEGIMATAIIARLY